MDWLDSKQIIENTQAKQRETFHWKKVAVERVKSLYAMSDEKAKKEIEALMAEIRPTVSEILEALNILEERSGKVWQKEIRTAILTASKSSANKKSKGSGYAKVA